MLYDSGATVPKRSRRNTSQKNVANRRADRYAERDKTAVMEEESRHERRMRWMVE